MAGENDEDADNSEADADVEDDEEITMMARRCDG